jgi:plastocyanin
MSFRWPNKDPDEQLDYSIDWSRFLGDSITIAGGDTVKGIQNVSQSHTNTVATINIGSGTNNVEYKFYCRITDTSGSQAERVVKLRVKER